MNVKKRGLGKDLSQLGIRELLSSIQTNQVPETNSINKNELRYLPLEMMRPGKYQPRREIDPERLEELAQSIRAQGIIQPLVVRPLSTGQYEIIAGERRWRAAQRIPLAEVPVVVREIADEAAMAMGLIENIQRQDLNALEEAMGMQRLLTEFGLTHQELAQAVGKARTTITNLLRLLTLPEEIKRMLQHNEVEVGHAKVLLSLPENQQVQTAKMIAAKKLSVRETEKLVAKMQKDPEHFKKEQEIDPNIKYLQTELSNKLGAAVTIQHQAKGTGKLIVQYHSLEELEGIMEHIR